MKTKFSKQYVDAARVAGLHETFIPKKWIKLFEKKKVKVKRKRKRYNPS